MKLCYTFAAMLCLSACTLTEPDEGKMDQLVEAIEKLPPEQRDTLEDNRENDSAAIALSTMPRGIALSTMRCKERPDIIGVATSGALRDVLKTFTEWDTAEIMRYLNAQAEANLARMRQQYNYTGPCTQLYTVEQGGKDVISASIDRDNARNTARWLLALADIVHRPEVLDVLGLYAVGGTVVYWGGRIAIGMLFCALSGGCPDNPSAPGTPAPVPAPGGDQ